MKCLKINQEERIKIKELKNEFNIFEKIYEGNNFDLENI